jgi:tripartite ATP-independent transporter DctP family solute receptor
MSRALAAATLCAALASICATATARDFRAADTQAEDYPTVQALTFMDKVVNERSGGRHRVRIFHSRQLGEEKETIEQTRAGAIDLNRTNVAPLGSFIPEANILALPFLFRSIEHLHKVLDGPVGDDILASFEPHGFIGLAFYDSGARSIYNAVRPIRTPADLKGLKLRVQQSALMVDMIKALGAEPIELPYGQVLTGLSTKLIDGALHDRAPLYAHRAHDESRGAGHVEPRLARTLAGGPDDLPACREGIKQVHAPTVDGVGNARAQPGREGRQHRHHAVRQGAVRSGDDRHLRPHDRQ